MNQQQAREEVERYRQLMDAPPMSESAIKYWIREFQRIAYLAKMRRPDWASK